MKNAAIILAAGRGLRAGGAQPKQWQTVAGQSSVARVLALFKAHQSIDVVVLVLHPDDMQHAADFNHILVAAGGDNRAASVKAGLNALSSERIDNVLIHDVARSCLSQEQIDAVLQALLTHEAAAPALAITDAIWRGKGAFVDTTVSREGLFRAQTPQGFRYAVIRKAHETSSDEAHDDVAVARAAGIEVAIVPGDPNNIKITTPDDFKRAEKILGGPMDIRTGNGFDVHAFEPGNHVTLCGVDIDHDKSLKGHSDADVAMHAITDAIYGALASGDIGQWFPPSDPQWKGAESHIFLSHAASLANDEGFTISHLDCTIICEQPKIGPHAKQMRERISNISGVSLDRVSIKATTSEQLGFTGRGEGIAAIATATLVKT